jgi:GDP-L-fucose synthase
MEKYDRVFISGHNGMVGSALLRKLKSLGYQNIITRNKSELDLRNQGEVKNFFEQEKPDIIFIIAARVGGIVANMTYPADFLYENLMIESNLIHYSHIHKAKKVIFLGSSCIYPRDSPQPMKEEYLLTGPLEPTNEAYAIAKIAGLKMIEYYKKQYNLNGLSLMPSNLYGPNDSFHPEHSHVFSASIKKVIDAIDSNSDSITVWGTGSAKREFLHIHDLIDAILFIEENFNSSEIINVGCGYDISIKELIERIISISGFKGKIVWDQTKPDGMPRKCMDVTKLFSLGFKPKVSIDEGIQQMINEYRTFKSNSLRTDK